MHISSSIYAINDLKHAVHLRIRTPIRCSFKPVLLAPGLQTAFSFCCFVLCSHTLLKSTALLHFSVFLTKITPAVYPPILTLLLLPLLSYLLPWLRFHPFPRMCPNVPSNHLHPPHPRSFLSSSFCLLPIPSFIHLSSAKQHSSSVIKAT